MNDHGRPISELEELALTKGDTSAYESLSIAYLDLPIKDFIPIARKMADKYDYTQAYFDFFAALMDSENMWVDDIEKWGNLNDSIKYLALRYLLLGAEREHHQSLDIIRYDFSRGKKLNKHIINDSRLVNEFNSLLDSLSVNKLKILVLIPYDIMANAGRSPRISECIEQNLSKMPDFDVILFPYKKLIGVPYQNVFDKKYCSPILEKINADLIVMSKLDYNRKIGTTSLDTWDFKIRIFNIANDTQIDSKLSGQDIAFKNICDTITTKIDTLRFEIINVCQHAVKNIGV